MELHLLRSPVSTPTLYSDHTHKRNPPIQCLRLSKRSSGPSTQKELSRILRTEAAVKNIERKANSNKYNNLWPKPVLEALDEAISNNLWENALKVCSLDFWLFWVYVLGWCLLYVSNPDKVDNFDWGE